MEIGCGGLEDREGTIVKKKIRLDSCEREVEEENLGPFFYFNCFFFKFYCNANCNCDSELSKVGITHNRRSNKKVEFHPKIIHMKHQKYMKRAVKWPQNTVHKDL